MKVTHVVNTTIACGYAEYGRELDAELNKEFDASITPFAKDVGDVDVVICSYGSPETPLTPQQTDNWRAEGKKVILLHRESEGNLTTKCVIPIQPFIGHVDAIVTHEPTDYGTEFIPISFPEVDNLPQVDDRLVIGEVGFYDPMKNFEAVIETARATGGFVNITTTPHNNVDLPRNVGMIEALKVRAIEGDSINSDFLPIPNLVRRLARSTVNMYWHNPPALCSQSTSVGLAIATKRPLIISGHRRFKVIYEQYEDEVYVVRQKTDAIDIVKHIWEAIQMDDRVKVPDKLYTAYSWTTCGETYRKLIHKVMGR